MSSSTEVKTGLAGEALVARARHFACSAHRGVGQLRKYTGQPYEVHLQRVAEIVAGVTDDPETLAAAWLHDVVEDTPTTIEEVERVFGRGVRELVDALTDVSQPSEGNRAFRKEVDRAHLAAAPARAQTVKLADLIDNCNDICTHNPRFGRVFVAEMAALLDALTKGDLTLMKRARKTLDKWSPRVSRVSPEPGSAPQAGEPASFPPRLRRAIETFEGFFGARDVAEPLTVLDAEEPPGAAVAPVVGVRRRGGPVNGYRLASQSGTGVRPIEATQVVDADAGLVEVVATLSRHDFCFVRQSGDITGYAGRNEMQGPVARMWLFGVVTTIELAMTERIRRLAGSTPIESLLTPARLAKARELRASRLALGRDASLLDCLQLVDKVRILQALDATPRALLHGASKAESQRLVRDLEDLRNSLAHAQDLVTHDWTQIVRLARRVRELAADLT